jgi:hypothetical protein
VNRKTSLVCAVALLILCSGRLAGQGSSGASKENPDHDLYPDSVAGLQSQMDELFHLVNSPDQQAFLSALDTLAIPKPHDWLEAHFPIYAVDGLQKDYQDAFAGYRSHVWWVMGNFAKNPAFGLKLEASEIPEPLAETGLEALLPRPDGGVKVENYRISPTLSKPPSWVSSFVYVEGRFRFVAAPTHSGMRS